MKTEWMEEIGEKVQEMRRQMLEEIEGYTHVCLQLEVR